MLNQLSKESEKVLKEYFKSLQEEFEIRVNLKEEPETIINRSRSYLIAILKGNQETREMPNEINSVTSRELRLLAIDRSLSESMCEFPEIEKNLMREHANIISMQREGSSGFGNALRDLVRLARLRSVSRGLAAE